MSACLLLELDTLNLLVKDVASGLEMVVTRSTIKKITPTPGHDYKGATGNDQR
jgi:hypothetical protein